MKRWYALLMLSVLLLLILPVSFVYAEDFEFLGFTFSSNTIYQGDSNRYVDLQIVTNNSTSVITLHGASVQFQWEEQPNFFVVGSQVAGEFLDLRKDLISGETYSFRIIFNVPATVPTGDYLFEFKVYYGNGQEETWVPGPFFALNILSMYEPLYKTLEPVVSNKILQAEGAGFISPDATSLLQRAEGLLDDAYLRAQQEDWQGAWSRLTSTSTLIDQAYAAEQRFRTYLYMGLAGAAGAAIAIGAGLLIRRRRRRSSKLSGEKVAKSSN